MPPEILLALGALTLAKTAIPVIQDWFKKGDVTAERQKEILDAYTALAKDIDAAFSGPEWEIEPDPD